MLTLSENGDNATVDMLVGDIYGSSYSRLGLKSTMIASSFGKVFKKGGKKENFSAEDISKSLLYAVSNNIGQIAYVLILPYTLHAVRLTEYQVHERREIQCGQDLFWRMLHQRYEPVFCVQGYTY